ncbi:MAG: hypothetical protein DRQ56_04230 [Gammaproteobacteria bacterium]|nr:MAG: hypothetical protein DRQ56_04230 [Gammaproteobacteria bacterium]
MEHKTFLKKLSEYAIWIKQPNPYEGRGRPGTTLPLEGGNITVLSLKEKESKCVYCQKSINCSKPLLRMNRFRFAGWKVYCMTCSTDVTDKDLDL